MNSPRPSKATLAALKNPDFWDHMFRLFCIEEKVVEFSEISGVPVERIRAARDKYLRDKLREAAAHSDPGNATLN